MDIKIIDNNIKFKLRVAAIICNKERLLVETYEKNSYTLPGGYVEVGEESKDALIRELQEELGLTFSIEKFAGISEDFFINKKGEKTHDIVLYYYTILPSNDYEKIPQERMEKGPYSDIFHHFTWLDLKDLSNYNLLPSKLKNFINNVELKI